MASVVRLIDDRLPPPAPLIFRTTVSPLTGLLDASTTDALSSTLAPGATVAVVGLRLRVLPLPEIILMLAVSLKPFRLAVKMSVPTVAPGVQLTSAMPFAPVVALAVARLPRLAVKETLTPGTGAPLVSTTVARTETGVVLPTTALVFPVVRLRLPMVTLAATVRSIRSVIDRLE